MELKDVKNTIELLLTKGDIKAARSLDDARWCYILAYQDGDYLDGFYVSKQDLERWIHFTLKILNGDGKLGDGFFNENGQSSLKVVETAGNVTCVFKSHSGKEIFRLSHVQLQQLHSKLPMEMASFFKSDYGKLPYIRYEVIKKQEDPEWAYRGTELEETLRTICIGRKIKHICVSLSNYLESCSAPRIFDLGAGITLIFTDGCMIDLNIYCEGVLSYRIYADDSITLTYEYGYIPEDIDTSYDNCYMYDVLNLFGESVNNTDIIDCKVFSETTVCIGFCPRDFNIKKAQFYNEVPSAVSLIFSNRRRLFIYGSDMEYFGLSIDDITSL